MDRIDYHEIPLYIVLKDTSEDKIDECRKTIRETLQNICDKGFDKQRLSALINRDEFSERELNTIRPKGLIFFSRAFRRWLYGGDPAAAMSLTAIYAKLRAGVANGMFESIVLDKILGNKHHAEVVLFPDAALEKQLMSEHVRRMASIRDAMSDADLARLEENVVKLKEYQQRKDSPEDIAKIPRLRSAELSQTGIPVSSEVQDGNGVVRIKTKTTADGVFYLMMYFPMDNFTADELLRMPLFAKLHGKLRTSRHSALELQTEIAANIGRISYSTVSTERGRYFKVSVA
jgi:Zn-dependent M16 (insulinase) family peptidase